MTGSQDNCDFQFDDLLNLSNEDVLNMDDSRRRVLMDFASNCLISVALGELDHQIDGQNTFDLLVRLGADVNAKVPDELRQAEGMTGYINGKFDTVFHLACMKGRKEVVSWFLALPCNEPPLHGTCSALQDDHWSHHHHSSLVAAAAAGQNTIVELILPLVWTTEMGTETYGFRTVCCALHEASSFGRLSVVQLLLANKTFVDEYISFICELPVTMCYWDPLGQATRNTHWPVVEALRLNVYNIPKVSTHIHLCEAEAV